MTLKGNTQFDTTPVSKQGAERKKKKFTSSITVPFRSVRLDFRFSPICPFPSWSS